MLKGELIFCMLLFLLVHMLIHGKGAKGLEHEQINTTEAEKSARLCQFHMAGGRILIQGSQGSQD